MASISADRAGSLPRVWWIAGLAAIAGAVVLLVQVVHLTDVDGVQQLNLLTSLRSGDLVRALESPQAQEQTSGPGFGLFGLPVFAVLGIFLSEHRAYVGAAFACLVPLAWATVAAARATGVAHRSVRELATVATVVLGAPIMANYFEALHPADVLATAACLGAFAAVSRQRTTWAFLLLGFALVTRQWAIIAVPILAVLERGDARRHLVIGSLGTAVVVMLPFLITNAGQTIFVMSAESTSQGPLMAMSLVDLDRSLAFVVGRWAPLIATVVLCAWLARRRVTWSPEVAVAALAVGFLVRPPVDPAGYLYYVAPGYAFFVLMGPRTWRWLAAGALGSVALLVRFVLREPFPIAESVGLTTVEGAFRAPGVGLAIASTTVLVAALVAAMLHLRALVAEGAAQLDAPEEPGVRRATAGSAS